MDNSVEAKAAHIDVMVTVGKARKTRKKKATDKITEIAVVDDGCGMNKGTLHKCKAFIFKLIDQSVFGKGHGIQILHCSQNCLLFPIGSAIVCGISGLVRRISLKFQLIN